MTLATCTADGFPSARVVLLKNYGEDGFTFGDIVDAIKEARGITIDRRNVHLEEPIRSVGTRMVVVEVEPGVTATVKTMVVEQK